jgi:hypothetical protein
VISELIPALRPLVGFDQHSPHHDYDIYTHTCRAVAACPADPVVRLAALFHDLSKPSVFTVDEDGNETLWFKITGFSNYNALHPNIMYIEDSQGNTYHFVNVEVYSDKYGSDLYVPDEEA